MADQGRSDFCVVFTMSLCTLESKRTLIKFAISSHTALKLGTQSLRTYLKVTCEYELHILPNTKVSTSKDHGENYVKVRPPLVGHLLRNRLLYTLIQKPLPWLLPQLHLTTEYYPYCLRHFKFFSATAQRLVCSPENTVRIISDWFKIWCT